MGPSGRPPQIRMCTTRPRRGFRDTPKRPCPCPEFARQIDGRSSDPQIMLLLSKIERLARTQLWIDLWITLRGGCLSTSLSDNNGTQKGRTCRRAALRTHKWTSVIFNRPGSHVGKMWIRSERPAGLPLFPHRPHGAPHRSRSFLRTGNICYFLTVIHVWNWE